MPDLLVFSTISPIMFILLFAYVFGSAINVPGTNYREYLIPGIFAQTVIFVSTTTGAGLADDMQKGIIDRFRSLPMSRAAVLIGRTGSDVVNNVLVIVIMSLTGLAVGWRIRSAVLDAIGGFLLLLLFAYAFSWIMAWVGLIVPSVEVVNNASFVVIFPLTFIANTFVPTNNFPAGAQMDRQLESGLVADPGLSQPVRQRQRDQAGRLLVARASRAVHAGLDRADPGHLRSAVGVDATRRPPAASCRGAPAHQRLHSSSTSRAVRPSGTTFSPLPL